MDSERIVSNIINDIDWDKKNEELWISTDGGISLFSPDENKFENFQETPFSESIKENFVGDILVSERSGNVWFKTKNYSGINCLRDGIMKNFKCMNINLITLRMMLWMNIL